jgi:hypothetical protein
VRDLDAGEIDAPISANVPRCFLDMRTVDIRRDLVVQLPLLAKTICQSFCGAKNVAAENYQHGRIFQQPFSASTLNREARKNIFVPEPLTTELPHQAHRLGFPE